MKTFIALLLTLLAQIYALQDTHKMCKDWADMGECENNPAYMLVNCKKSCDSYNKKMGLEDNSDLVRIRSFFQLGAKDIDGKEISFQELKGKITVVVNVASHCGYTESHYRGLVDLYNAVPRENVNILAFPCNQFGAQEPEECPVIKRFAESKGVEFTMMDKVDVNGPNASPVYRFLKREAGPPHIQWNFATYFVIDPEGQIRSFSGVEPMDLLDLIMGIIDGDAEEL